MTRIAHQRLDHDLSLLSKPLSQQRFIDFLAGLLGFFQVWEPAVAASPQARRYLTGTSRLPDLTSDLTRLNVQQHEIAAIPACSAASELVRSPGLALGSLYVILGSRQGARVIGRAVSSAPWAPPEGLAYFSDDPRANAAWNGLVTALHQTPWPSTDPEIARGALKTFDVLHTWLTRSAIA
ncbi:biliverdin-producing heme oxygenase [Kineosporia sp. NBRC 101731]|uniref:biliverdin-producing heme oxygenase n=1 Tax=Kineosporia sp. NBRC 101731 TaxID=3032199 RepID=UPI00255649D8|nr:biliverdin-producing heme oxygenase [Kineosporia sp. NBRC 101731]